MTELEETKREIESNGISTVGCETLERYAKLSVQYLHALQSGPVNTVVRVDLLR